MADPPPRRRLQFRLRTLMIVVTLLAVACGYLGRQAEIVRERKAFCESPQFCMVVCSDCTHAPWIRRILGDFDCLFVIADDNVSDAELERCRIAFPEMDVRRDREQPNDSRVQFRNGTLTVGATRE